MSAEPERVYVINLGKVLLSQPQHRSVRAINMIREFARRHMKEDNIKIDESLAQLIWSKGVRRPPRKIRVRMNRVESGYIRVSSYDNADDIMGNIVDDDSNNKTDVPVSSSPELSSEPLNEDSKLDTSDIKQNEQTTDLESDTTTQTETGLDNELKPADQTEPDKDNEIKPTTQTETGLNNELKPADQTEPDKDNEIKPTTQTETGLNNELKPADQTEPDKDNEIKPTTQTETGLNNELKPADQTEPDKDNEINTDTKSNNS